MFQPGPVQRFAIQRGGLDIDVLRAVVLGQHRELLAVVSLGVQRNNRLADHRTANHIDATGGIDGVKAQRAEDVPGRHLTAVNVSALASRRVVKQRRHDLPHMLLRLVRGASVIV